MDAYAYIDTAHPGDANMSIDRRLLEMAEHQQSAFVRFYRWSEPTLSLGHFQSTTDRRAHSPSQNLTTVQRASGGGAIVHHHEWTYAIAIPVGRQCVGAATHLYDCVHDALVSGFNAFGWQTAKWVKPCSSATTLPDSPAYSPSASGTGCGSESAQQPGGRKPSPEFLCFLRRSCGDIVAGSHKIVGSAQRRLGTSVLQHGSILCAASPFAPELPGLAELPRWHHLAPPQHQACLSFPTKADMENDGFAQILLCWILNALEERFEVVPKFLTNSPLA